jgi:hypothetical protein
LISKAAASRGPSGARVAGAKEMLKMRTILFAAALSISGIAFAQTQPTTTETETQQPSGETVDDPSQATGPEGITQQGTDPQGQATTPPGMNQPVGTSPMMTPDSNMATTPRPATTEYPPCSRTVTDSCVQTYERGVRRSSRPRR